MGNRTVASELPEEVARYNRGMFKIAVAGGLTAAFLLTFLAPTWSASTRLDSGMFDLLLALGALSLFPFIKVSFDWLYMALSCFLFALGVVESAGFLLLLPVYAFLSLNRFILSSRRSAVLGCLLVSGAGGLAVALYAVRLNMADLGPLSLTGLLRTFFIGLTAHHYHELGSFLPRTGWMQIVLQTGLPSVILLFGRQQLFKKRSVSTLLAVLLLGGAAVPGMLNLSIAPFSYFQAFGHLPVLGYAIFAASVATALAACLVFIAPEDVPQDEPSQQKQTLLTCRRGMAGVFFALFALLVVLTPFRCFRAVDARQGGVADEVARMILGAMKSRTWLVSNGFLEDHLRIQAFMAHQPLNLVSLRGRTSPEEQRRMRELIESEDAFEGLNRQRLVNALSIGTVHFVMEWFKSDANAGTRAMVFATPDIWTECGYRAIPEGLAFGGVRPEQKPDLAAIEQMNETFAVQLLPLIGRAENIAPHLAALCGMLRMKASFTFNELGVMLENGGEFEKAYQAYQRAYEIEPANVSAAINSYTLVLLRQIHAEALDGLKKKMKVALSNRDIPVRGLMGVLQNYGTIRDPAYYQQQATMWSALGSRAIASDKLRQALVLAEETGAAGLVQKAMVYSFSGDLEKAKACYLEALQADAANVQALSGLCTLMLTQHKITEAEKLIQKARGAGSDQDALLYQTITIAILKQNTKEALRLLKRATEKYPDDLRYWMLQADVLLNQGDTAQVEYTLLPEMKKRWKNGDHFLVSVIQGFVLRKKGPQYYKEARLSLLKALSMNAALPEVWDAVFKLDVALGNLEFTETDARSMLAIDSNHAFANYLMGVCLLAKGKLKAAEDFQRRSIEKSPTAVACNDLAENLRLQKQLPEAERFARQALTLSPDMPPALDTLACVLCDAGRFDESARVAEKSVAAKPDSPIYQLTLLRAFVRLGDRHAVQERKTILKSKNIAIPSELQKEIGALK